MSISTERRRKLLTTPTVSVSKYKTENTNKVLRFNLSLNTRVKQILQKYAEGRNMKEYQELVISIRDNAFTDNEILMLLQESAQCICVLNADLRLFVESIFLLKWPNKSQAVVNEYRSFLINLLCAHNYHLKFAMEMLVSYFIPGADEKQWKNGTPSEAECIIFGNVHIVIKTLLKLVPMSQEILLHSLITMYPYVKKSAHIHEVYVHNIMWIFSYEPELRTDLLLLIYKRLIELDVHAPRDEILWAEQNQFNDEQFSMDDFKSMSSLCITETTKHPVAATLDVCLDKIFNYIFSECFNCATNEINLSKTKKIFQSFLTVFDTVILPTFNTHHVQFTFFLICSFDLSICQLFLTHLWKKVCDPNVAMVHRQTAVAYISGMLARAAFIPIQMLKSTLIEISKWIHFYISQQDGLESINSDLRLHAVFYSACQALFYVIAFRHRDLLHNHDSAFVEDLNLSKIVTSRLNPLRSCVPRVVQNFATVSRKYQLVYCYTIMQHNTRLVMPTIYFDDKGSIQITGSIIEAFFPFDPFLLKISGEKIHDKYLNYNSNEDDMDIKDDDDFLETVNRFSYSTSPGFKYKT